MSQRAGPTARRGNLNVVRGFGAALILASTTALGWGIRADTAVVFWISAGLASAGLLAGLFAVFSGRAAPIIAGVSLAGLVSAATIGLTWLSIDRLQSRGIRWRAFNTLMAGTALLYTVAFILGTCALILRLVARARSNSHASSPRDSRTSVN